MKKSVLALLCGTFLSVPVWAGLGDAILAYDYQQYPAALAEFTYLQEEGDPMSAYYLGKMYQLGQGVSQDLYRAVSFYNMADAGYYFPASVELGKILIAEGRYDEGMALLRKAALAGEVEAAYELAEAYAKGKSVEKNFNYAFGFYKIAALGGHMKAQYQLGKMYLSGRGVPQDYEYALKWMVRAANQGYVLAQIDLAELRTNNPRLKNLPSAYRWYSLIAAYNLDEIGQKAAEKRDILLKGQKLKKNVVEEIQKSLGEWSPKPAEKSVPLSEIQNEKIPLINGFNDAKTLQGFILKEGFLPRSGKRFGVTTKMIDDVLISQDVHPLIEQIEKVQKEGQNSAYGYLGDLYKTRLNNLPEAFLWYQKGAEAGDLYSQYQLALMYCNGIGISQPDAAECYAWLSLVKEADDPMYIFLAQNAISIVRSTATSEELEAGLVRKEQIKTKTPKTENKSKSGSVSII